MFSLDDIKTYFMHNNVYVRPIPNFEKTWAYLIQLHKYLFNSPIVHKRYPIKIVNKTNRVSLYVPLYISGSSLINLSTFSAITPENSEIFCKLIPNSKFATILHGFRFMHDLSGMYNLPEELDSDYSTYTVTIQQKLPMESTITVFYQQKALLEINIRKNKYHEVYMIKCFLVNDIIVFTNSIYTSYHDIVIKPESIKYSYYNVSFEEHVDRFFVHYNSLDEIAEEPYYDEYLTTSQLTESDIQYQVIDINRRDFAY